MFGTHCFVFHATRTAKILFSALEEGSRANEPSFEASSQRIAASGTQIGSPNLDFRSPRAPNRAPRGSSETLERPLERRGDPRSSSERSIASKRDACAADRTSNRSSGYCLAPPPPCPVELKCDIENDSSPSIAPHAGPPRGVGGLKRPAATCADPWGEIAKKFEYVRNALLRSSSNSNQILFSALGKASRASEPSQRRNTHRYRYESQREV